MMKEFAFCRTERSLTLKGALLSAERSAPFGFRERSFHHWGALHYFFGVGIVAPTVYLCTVEHHGGNRISGGSFQFLGAKVQIKSHSCKQIR